MTATTLVADHRELAAILLDRADLELHPGIDRGQALAMLARVLNQYQPPKSPHGVLLVRSLIPGLEPRTPQEQAVRRIIAGGRAPTPRAVLGELRQAEESRQAWQARKDRLRRLVDAEGPAAAAAEDLWRTRRKAPGPQLLGLARGWHPRDTWAWLAVLTEAGWLSNQNRRLTPGPRATHSP